GFVVAHVDSGSCFDLSYKETTANILQIEIPYSLLSSLITTREGKFPLAERYRVPDKYRLKPESDEHPSPSASGVQVTTPPDTRL
ncbi:hypothetical protein OFM93_30860, partial [Escherichia coli]|nr:hypothetical protein [Escherichia coli]